MGVTRWRINSWRITQERPFFPQGHGNLLCSSSPGQDIVQRWWHIYQLRLDDLGKLTWGGMILSATVYPIKYAHDFVLLCIIVISSTVLSAFTWCIYPYFSGLLRWHWDSHASNHQGYGLNWLTINHQKYYTLQVMFSSLTTQSEICLAVI